MNTIRLAMITVALILIQPVFLFADECAEIKANAGKVFDTARGASVEKQYEKAIELYTEAEEYFREVSNMECSNPGLSDSAKEGMQICRDNIENNKKALENKVYDQAKEIFNQGNSYARESQWEDAINSFNEAATIWETIASDKTETGKKAIESVKKANDLEALSRKRNGSNK